MKPNKNPKDLGSSCSESILVRSQKWKVKSYKIKTTGMVSAFVHVGKYDTKAAD